MNRQQFVSINAFLKGIIVGHAQFEQGQAKTSVEVDKTSWSKEFASGYKMGVGKGRQGQYDRRDFITHVHIIYNRLRGTGPHTGDAVRDEAILKDHRGTYAYAEIRNAIKSVEDGVCLVEAFNELL